MLLLDVKIFLMSKSLIDTTTGVSLYLIVHLKVISRFISCFVFQLKIVKGSNTHSTNIKVPSQFEVFHLCHRVYLPHFKMGCEQRINNSQCVNHAESTNSRTNCTNSDTVPSLDSHSNGNLSKITLHHHGTYFKNCSVNEIFYKLIVPLYMTDDCDLTFQSIQLQQPHCKTAIMFTSMNKYKCTQQTIINGISGLSDQIFYSLRTFNYEFYWLNSVPTVTI